LKVNQFITATITLPPQPGEVEVPTDALLEDGRDSVVFVQPDPTLSRFARRPVEVTRRYHDVVYVRAGSAGGGAGLRPGERVVVGGALQLNEALGTTGR
jgi:cobalt-zinc-cadmium efflux system membrane fusion protein